ncbi:NUDIX domain-containing protein [Exiguobacterium sp. s59]|uniref:NUDIX hydrolase n=1 Tax=Exiguobacterium sp. s59 TaxID=2751269 RepID=UPI001BEA8B04|nr:NUDIX domain-containing protein [Exiguobacterium sp. s59]
MKEYLTIFDENHQKIGEKERGQVHVDGDWHETFHCWFWKDRFVYLQRRSTEKQDFPGKYDITAAGHLATDETVVDGVREIEEELGLSLTFEQLTSLGIFEDVIELNGFLDREYAHTYSYAYQDEPLHFDDQEVMDVVALQRSELRALTEGRLRTIEGSSLMTNHHVQITQADLVPHRLTYWQHVFESLARIDTLNR